MSEMNDDQITHMVSRFLQWRLPANFNPDAGISFKPAFNEHTDHPMRHEPVGTNLFDARQAEEMVRFMVEGLSAIRETAFREGAEAMREAIADEIRISTLPMVSTDAANFPLPPCPPREGDGE